MSQKVRFGLQSIALEMGNQELKTSSFAEKMQTFSHQALGGCNSGMTGKKNDRKTPPLGEELGKD